MYILTRRNLDTGRELVAQYPTKTQQECHSIFMDRVMQAWATHTHVVIMLQREDEQGKRHTECVFANYKETD